MSRYVVSLKHFDLPSRYVLSGEDEDVFLVAIIKKNKFWIQFKKTKVISLHANFLKCSLTFQSVPATDVKEGDHIGIF